MSEFECCPNPKCSVDLSSNPEYRFCLVCGTDLKRANVFVECCGVSITHPLAQKRKFTAFCPICGRSTGQISPSILALKRDARKKEWDEEEAQRKRVLNPPLLSNVHILPRNTGCKAGASDSPDDILLNEGRCRLIIKDILRALCKRDHRIIVVTESVKQLETLYKYFESDVDRVPSMQGILVWHGPTSEKRDVVKEQFSRDYVVFTTTKILNELNLPRANRIFVASPFISEGWLKTVSRLFSSANGSKNPKIIEYVDIKGDFLILHQKKMHHYVKEEAVIVKGDRS